MLSGCAVVVLEQNKQKLPTQLTLPTLFIHRPKLDSKLTVLLRNKLLGRYDEIIFNSLPQCHFAHEHFIFNITLSNIIGM